MKGAPLQTVAQDFIVRDRERVVQPTMSVRRNGSPRRRFHGHQTERADDRSHAMREEVLVWKVGQELTPSGMVEFSGKTMRRLMDDMFTLPSENLVTNAVDLLFLRGGKPLSTLCDYHEVLPPEQSKVYRNFLGKVLGIAKDRVWQRRR